MSTGNEERLYLGIGRALFGFKFELRTYFGGGGKSVKLSFFVLLWS